MGYLSLLEKSTEFQQFKDLCQQTSVPPSVLRDYLVAIDLYDGTPDSITNSLVYLGKKHAPHVTFNGPIAGAKLVRLVRSQKVDREAVAAAYENPEDSERIIIDIAGEPQNGDATALLPSRELLQFVSGGAAKLKKIAASQRTAEKKKAREEKARALAEAREQKRQDAIAKKTALIAEREKQKAEREQARAEGRKLPRKKAASLPATTKDALFAQAVAIGVELPPPAPVLTAAEFNAGRPSPPPPPETPPPPPLEATHEEQPPFHPGPPSSELELDPDVQVAFTPPPIVVSQPESAPLDTLLARPGSEIKADLHQDRDILLALAEAHKRGLALIGEAFFQAADWVGSVLREHGQKK